MPFILALSMIVYDSASIQILKFGANYQFLISFTVVHICGTQKFSAEIDMENIIYAPPYPGSHGSTMDCWYTITAPENTRIRFWVDDFGTKTFNSQRYFMQVKNDHFF